MARILAEVFAARLQEKKLMVTVCSRCHDVFLSKRRDNGTYPKTCEPCRRYAKFARGRDAKTTEQRRVAREEKHKALLARDPALKAMKDGYVEFVPVKPSKQIPKHNSRAVKTICGQVRRDRKRFDRRNPWGE